MSHGNGNLLHAGQVPSQARRRRGQLWLLGLNDEVTKVGPLLSAPPPKFLHRVHSLKILAPIMIPRNRLRVGGTGRTS